MFRATLSDHAQKTLALLGKSGLTDKAYLAGGSALALYFGHRYSIDFDFFTLEQFEPKKLAEKFKKIGNFKQTVAKGISLAGEFNEIKLSYFQYDYPLIGKLKKFRDVNIASIEDIAAMKIVAITDRGIKRDFVDLFEIIRQGSDLDKIFKYYDNKYKAFKENQYSIIRSLQYFDDAEETEMPKMIKPIVWDEVKEFFIKETIRLAKKEGITD